MAIARVIKARCVPHQLDQFMASLAEAKKIIEGHGARATFYSSSAGGTPNTVTIVSEVDDWVKFGEHSAKVSADPAFQGLQRRAVDDPFAEILSHEIVEQFELP